MSALGLCALLLAPTVPDDAWVERLEFPRLMQADLNLMVRDQDLGIHEKDLGFPSDPTVRVEEAIARLQDGDRSARTLHQAASGFASLRAGQQFSEVMPACLDAYTTELKATPDDHDLRENFSRALMTAATMVRDDRFFLEAGLQLAKVSQAQPDEWRFLEQQAKVLVTRALLSTEAATGGERWLERATLLADQAIAMAPEEVAPRWRRFHASYMGLMHRARGSNEKLFEELIGLALGVIEDAETVEEPRLAMIGDAYWSIAILAPAVGKDGGYHPPENVDAIAERLAQIGERLNAQEASALRADAARIWCSACMFLSPAEKWEENREAAVSMGVSPEMTSVLSLMGLHKRAAPELAAEAAKQLEEQGPGDDGWRALTVYNYEIGDYAKALECQANVEAPDPALRFARAHLMVREGQLQEALAELTELSALVSGTPNAGPVAHLHGVAYALNGDTQAAKVRLTLASTLLTGDAQEKAAATLAELE